MPLATCIRLATLPMDLLTHVFLFGLWEQKLNTKYPSILSTDREACLAHGRP